MKRCPTCQRTYPDDAPDFCTADGTRLVKAEGEAYDPLKTMVASQPPPPPPPQYANPAVPPGVPQASPSMPPPPQPGWPPPPQQQQGQNWAGGYYPAQQGYAPPATRSNVLALVALILGAVSAVLATLLLLEERQIMRTVGGRGAADPYVWGAAITGIAAIIIGVVALILKRQGGKLLAIIGMVLAAYSIAFWIYLESEYGFIFV